MVMWRMFTGDGAGGDGGVKEVSGLFSARCSQFALVLQLSAADWVITQIDARRRHTARLRRCNTTAPDRLVGWLSKV